MTTDHSPTSRFTCSNVDLVVASAVVRDPAHRRGEGIDDFLVEDTYALGGRIVSINAYGAIVFASWLESLEEVCPALRVQDLGQNMVIYLKLFYVWMMYPMLTTT